MPNPDWLQLALSSFEVRAEPFMEIAVADEIRIVRNGQGDLDDASWAAFLAEHSAFMFFERAGENSVWGTYFAPMIESVTAEGEKAFQPDVAKLSGGTVRHWEERVGQTTHSILRARYADCVWDLERTITRGKRQHKYAILAIESYMETVRRDGFADEFDVAALPRALSITGVQMLARALQLARSINASELMTTAASEMISFCSRHGDPAHAGIWLAPFDHLYGKKQLLTSEQENRIISDLETMLKRTSSAEHGQDFNPFGAESAAERLIKHYNRAAETKRLVQVYGLAFERMARDASPLLALAWMQPLIERYQQAGLTAESERLANFAAEKGKHVGDDMHTYSVEVPVDPEQVDKFIDDLLGGSKLEVKLFRIGHYFTPVTAQVKESLNFAREQTPLLTLFEKKIISPDGRTTARIGSIDDDLEGRLRNQTTDHIGRSLFFLSISLSQLRVRDKPTASQIVDVLYGCPLFSEKRKSLLTEGIAAYLADDWVKAIHVLVTQMEEVLRNLLAATGVPVTKTVRNNPGVTDLKNMGDVLSDERIKLVLGEDRWRYLSVLYIDRRGVNLRNLITHGLLSQEAFNQNTADLVFHSFLSICVLRKA